jgi:glycosyltransferase involved in cell wall biosynthesis
MDEELECDFYFGDKLPGDIKAMDYHSLTGYKRSLKNVWLGGNFYWQINSVGLVFKPYKHFIIDGEPFCVSSWIILLFAKILGKETYCWTHGWYGRETLTKKILKNIFFSMAHHIFLYGDYAKEIMQKEGFPANKLSCIYNSLDFDNQISLRVTLKPTPLYKNHFKNDYLNLIFIGRLTSAKRLDLLINAIAKLKDQSHNYNLTLIGESERKNELLSLSIKLGLKENIWFYGACYDERNISELIFNADICVSPGNVGLTAIHSMTYGTPTITHNNFSHQGPEFEAIIDGNTGTFFEYENCDSLVESIIRWNALVSDRELVRKNCYEIIDTKYNPHYQIALLKKVINNQD